MTGVTLGTDASTPRPIVFSTRFAISLQYSACKRFLDRGVSVDVSPIDEAKCSGLAFQDL